MLKEVFDWITLNPWKIISVGIIAIIAFGTGLPQLYKDTSPDAYTPTLGFATKVVSINVLLFFLLIGFVFWLAGLAGKKDWEDPEGSVS